MALQSPYFTEEHEMFRQSARQFFDRYKSEFEKWETEHEIPKSVWKEFGEMGFNGLMYPEQYGGSNVDFFYSVALLEEIGRTGNAGFGAAFVVHAYLATSYIHHIGSEELKQKYLAPAISGDLLGAIAFTEPDAGSDVMSIKTFAKKEGDHYIINGAKTYITNGNSADFYTTLCKTESGFDLLIIDGNAQGVSRNKLKKLGLHSSDTAEVFFDNVKIPASNLIGQEGMGFYYVMGGFQLERLALAIACIGAIEYALEITLEFMKNRKAFGRDIQKFQVLRHRIADHYTELEAMRQLVHFSSWQLQNDIYDVKVASMAKLKATELANEVVADCVQIHGGAGFMDEYLISRMFRDAKVGTIYGGTSEIMREIIAKVAIDKIEFSKVF